MKASINSEDEKEADYSIISGDKRSEEFKLDTKIQAR
jgi:hypothetical protein